MLQAQQSAACDFYVTWLRSADTRWRWNESCGKQDTGNTSEPVFMNTWPLNCTNLNSVDFFACEQNVVGPTNVFSGICCVYWHIDVLFVKRGFRWWASRPSCLRWKKPLTASNHEFLTEWWRTGRGSGWRGEGERERANPSSTSQWSTTSLSQPHTHQLHTYLPWRPPTLHHMLEREYFLHERLKE